MSNDQIQIPNQNLYDYSIPQNNDIIPIDIDYIYNIDQNNDIQFYESCKLYISILESRLETL
jgi:hypothetical protein